VYQPEVKLAFVKRYCNPASGWRFFVDIDPAEVGKAGGWPKTEKAWLRKKQMQDRGQRAIEALEKLGAKVGGSRAKWLSALADELGVSESPTIPGDRDIIAINPSLRRLLVAEVEGASTGQPEQKIYKAVGQIVVAVGAVDPKAFDASFIIAVHGEQLKNHLQKAKPLECIGVSAVCIEKDQSQDVLLFGSALNQRRDGAQIR